MLDLVRLAQVLRNEGFGVAEPYSDEGVFNATLLIDGQRWDVQAVNTTGMSQDEIDDAVPMQDKLIDSDFPAEISTIFADYNFTVVLAWPRDKDLPELS